MGRYLSCGVAYTIYIKNLGDDNKNEEVLSRIGQNIDLSLYDRSDEKNDKYIILKMKKDIFEKNIVEFIEEQSNYFDQYSRTKIKQDLEKIKGKEYKELMEIATKHSLQSFCFFKGNEICNDAFYLDSDMKSLIFCDIIDFYSTGKILIENYAIFFSYLRRCTIETSNNPIKTALVLTIIG